MNLALHTTRVQTHALLKTIDLLYGAACDPDGWPAFLDAASNLFDAQGAQVGHHDLKDHNLSFSRVAGYEWSPEHYRKYDTLMPKDPRLPYFAANAFKAVHCRMGLEEQELHGSEVYQQVLQPGGVEYSLGVNLSREAQSLSYFLALRTPDQPPFTQTECDLLDELVPHLSRALLLQRKFRKLDFEKRILSDTMDNMAIGLMIVDKFAGIKFANSTARDMIETKEALHRDNGRICAKKEAGKKLHQMIHRIVTMASTKPDPVNLTTSETMSLPDGTLGDPFVITVCPLIFGRAPGWGNRQEPLALLVVRDGKRPVENTGEALGRMFGLTQSQARLASLIAIGSSLRQAADEMGITEGSARQYLKVVFEKMGVTRQGELIVKTMNLPLLTQKTPAKGQAGP